MPARPSTFANYLPLRISPALPRTPHSRFVATHQTDSSENLAALVAAFLDVDAAVFEQPAAEFFA